METQTSSPRTRWRGVAGAVAAVIVVGSLAGLLLLSANHGHTGVTASATQTRTTIPPTPTGNDSNPGTQLQPSQFPVVAASNPQIVYRIVNNVPQRSTDGGATYHNLTIQQSDITDIRDSWLTVSPLDASHVFVTLVGLRHGQQCVPQASASAPSASANAPIVGVTLSGYVPCGDQLYSPDGGQTWSRLHLPTNDTFGWLGESRAIAAANNDASEAVFQGQGDRLYATVGYAAQGGMFSDGGYGRLYTSIDGGATWGLADQSIKNAGSTVCDFAVAPTGSTVYALAAPTSEGCIVFGNHVGSAPSSMSLYRSDKAGQSWTHVRKMPTAVDGGMAVAVSGALYIYNPVEQSSGLPANTMQYALVSLDKGVTFHGAPSAGLPAHSALENPVATLSDGSVVYEYVTGTSSSIASWKSGQSAWQPITLSGSYAIAAVVATPANGGDTLSVIDWNGAIHTLQVNG
jgi:hypothetical protein